MGVSFSSELDPTLNETEAKSWATAKAAVRMTFRDAEALVNCYSTYSFQPILDEDQLRSLVNIANSNRNGSKTTSLLTALSKIFERNSIFFSLEILATVILLADAPWPKRCALLFDLFKCPGIEEMAHDDFILAVQVVASSLFRLWKADPWNQEELMELCEDLADNAFTKLEKDFDQTIDKESFILWAVDRFRESRTVATAESLTRLLASQFD